MVSTEKTSNPIFISAIGLSLLLHVLLVILIVNTPIKPKVISKSDYESFLKEMSRPRRQAVILPAPKEQPKVIVAPANKNVITEKFVTGPSMPEAASPSVAPRQESAPQASSGPEPSSGSGGGSGGGKGTGRGTGNGSGSGSGSGTAKGSSVRTAGILGVIGATGGTGPGAGVGNVFSEGSGKLSDKLGGVMGGKQRAEMANTSNISRSGLGKGGAGGGGAGGVKPADIGGIATASSGHADAGSRKQSDIPSAHVVSAGGGLLSGNVDQVAAVSVISRKNASFTRCYEMGLRNNPNLAGRVGYEISVVEEGSVMDVRFVEDTLRSREVLDCIKSILLRLNFPKPKGGPAVLSSVLVFGTT